MERVGLTPEDIKAKNIAFYEIMISNREKYIKKLKRRDISIKRYFKLSILLLVFSLLYLLYALCIQDKSEAHYIILALTFLNAILSFRKLKINDSISSIESTQYEINKFHKLIEQEK